MHCYLYWEIKVIPLVFKLFHINIGEYAKQCNSSLNTIFNIVEG